LQADEGITALALSPDGRVLASGSGFQDPTLRIWDATTGRLLSRLEGHTAWVCQLAFTLDGLRLISAGSDQSIRIWDTTSWTESRVLHGHTDEVHCVAISEPAQLIASASKDGDLMLWRDDGKRAADGYQRLPEGLGYDEIPPLDGSRILLLPPDRVPEVRDLRSDLPAIPLPEIGSSSNVLGYFEGNRLCHWNGTDKILISELQGVKLIERGRIPLASATRPTGLHYSSTGPFVAWTQPSSPTAVYCAKLAEPGRRIELRSDLPGLVHFSFGKDGKHLAATTKDWQSFRVWNIETGSVVVSQNGPFGDFAFSGGGRVFAVSVLIGPDHETQFYDLDRPGIPPRRVPGKTSLHVAGGFAGGPDGRGGDPRWFAATDGSGGGDVAR
jgi:WD40 repeat protein